MHQFIDFSLRHWELWLAFFVLLGLFFGLEFHGKATGIPAISPQQATLLINREDAVVLDLRNTDIFAKGTIIGAINIPLTEFEAKQAQLDKHQTKPIILVTSQGQSPSKIVALLKLRGFNKINHLNGGISAWQSAGLPLKK